MKFIKVNDLHLQSILQNIKLADLKLFFSFSNDIIKKHNIKLKHEIININKLKKVQIIQNIIS